MEKPFCYNPFNSLFVEISTNEQPYILPCCTYGGHLPGADFLNSKNKPVNTIAEYLASDRLEYLKDHFIKNNSFPSLGCLSCKQKEQHGLTSFRQLYRKDHELHDFDPALKYVEIMLDAQCNMACFMCTPSSSSTFAQEYVKLGWLEQVPKGNTYSIIPELNSLPDNIHLNVIGGEPFMSKHFNDLLDIAIKKNWTVGITTNASLVNKKILKQLTQIKGVKLTVSMDGTGQLYSLMRWPSDWLTFTDNFQLLKDQVKGNHNKFSQPLTVNSVIQVLNVCDLKNIFEWTSSQGVHLRLSAILGESPWTGFKILEPKERDKLIPWLKEFLHTEILLYQKKEIIGWIKILEEDTTDYTLREQFLNKIPKILKHRGIDITAATKNLFYADRLAQQLKERYDSL